MDVTLHPCMRRVRRKPGTQTIRRSLSRLSLRESRISGLFKRFAGSDLFDQIDDAAAELGVRDARERPRQRQTLRGREKVGDIGRRSAFAEAFGIRGPGWPSLEQEGYRDLKDLRNLLDTAGTDPVGALLIFLDLLKCEAKCFAELFLAQAKHNAAHPHPTADILVNRVRRFSRHFQLSLRPGGERGGRSWLSLGACVVKSCSEIGEDCRQVEQRTDGTVLAAPQCELQRRSVN